jgi:hypothetical protein
LAEQIADSSDTSAPFWCTVAPGLLKNYAVLIGKAEEGRQRTPGAYRPYADLVMLYYRAGRSQDALRMFESSPLKSNLERNKAGPAASTTDFYLQALVLSGVGEGDKARAALALGIQTEERYKNRASGVPWSHLIAYELLRNEAEALIEKSGPGRDVTFSPTR